MAGVIWLEGEAGAVLTLPAPLPLAIERRVAEGLMRVIPEPGAGPARDQAESSPAAIPDEPEGARELPEPEAVPMPSNGASRAEWERYALSQGLAPDRVEGMTRNQLAQAMRLRSVS